MNKLAVTFIFIALAESAFASGVNYAANMAQSVQHRVTIEGPAVVSPNADAELVAALNRKVESQLQQVTKDLDDKINAQLGMSLR